MSLKTIRLMVGFLFFLGRAFGAALYFLPSVRMLDFVSSWRGGMTIKFFGIIFLALIVFPIGFAWLLGRWFFPRRRTDTDTSP